MWEGGGGGGGRAQRYEGFSVTKRYMGVGGYLADRYITLIFNFICKNQRNFVGGVWASVTKRYIHGGGWVARIYKKA